MSGTQRLHKNVYSSTFAFLVSVVSTPVFAASFDCGDAKIAAEKSICESRVISELDEALDVLYRQTLAKANEDEKQKLVSQQKHWLEHTRNRCRKEVCFKHAYWMRQAELAYHLAPKSPTYAKEADKAAAIKKVLETASLGTGTHSSPSFCRQMLADLKVMRNIRFVEPVVQTMSYEDPALEPWRARFESNDDTGQPLTFTYAFDSIFSGDDVKTTIDEGKAYYGLPPYKIYALPPHGSSKTVRYVFFSANEYGPTNREKEEPRILHSATFGELLHPATGRSIFVTSSWVAEDGQEYNGIFEYRRRYFILNLEPNPTKTYRLLVNFTDANASCNWYSTY